MERKIGEEFEFIGYTLIISEQDTCNCRKCFFYEHDLACYRKEIKDITGNCRLERSPGVIFKEVKVSNVNEPFLLIYKKGYIIHTNDMCDFTTHQNREITAEEILSLEITEPSYRPFKTKEECWEEMKNHRPFGWLRHKCIGYYEPIRVIISKDTSFKFLFNTYNFADGTPFGILKN